MAYGLRPVSANDLPMLRRWLSSPECMRWWGEPQAEYALIEDDLANPLMRMRIVSLDGVPFAYVQDYDVGSWPQAHLAHLPEGTRAVDTFIGEPHMLGCGHGSSYLRLVAERLIAEGAPLVAIDPSPANLRALHAYARAGFAEDRLVDTPDGPALLMLFRSPFLKGRGWGEGGPFPVDGGAQEASPSLVALWAPPCEHPHPGLLPSREKERRFILTRARYSPPSHSAPR